MVGQIFIITLYVIVVSISILIFIQSVYTIALSIFGYKKPKSYAQHTPESRFLVMIPACNEEKVISDIIKSLEQVEYPKNLLSIFVIADNCTDRTEEIVKAYGVNVIRTNSVSGEPHGKPYAIRKALEQLPGYHELYDLFVIFDADNLVSKNFFAEINSQYIDMNKPEVIQAYLGCKNMRGVLPYVYYTDYTVTNRFFQAARYNTGLNASIGGTGVAVSTQYLWEKGGWLSSCLTEDFEFQIHTTIDGGRILWNHNARIYDEKPTKVRQCYRQRTRWAQGHWYVAVRNTYGILRGAFRKTVKPMEAFTTPLYMYSMSRPLQIIATLAIILIMVISGESQPITSDILLVLLNWVIFSLNIFTVLRFVYFHFVLFPISVWKDNGRIIKVWEIFWAVICQILFIPISLASQCVGFLRMRRQNVWNKTEHTINVL